MRRISSVSSVRVLVRRDCCAERVEMWDDVWEAREDKLVVVVEEGVGFWWCWWGWGWRVGKGGWS